MTWARTMTVRRGGAVVLLLGMATASLVAGESVPATRAPESVAYEKDLKPLLQTYCFECHGDKKQKGELNLATITNDEAARSANKIWRGVFDRVRIREMPPEKSPQPTAEELQRLMKGLAILKRPVGPPDPGRVTIRRLNRSEYDNTIRDLVGLDLKLAADFPADDVGDGFDNISEVLSLSPILLEKYLDAANQVLDKAIVEEQVALKLSGEQLPALIEGKPVTGKPDGKGRTFTAIGEVQLDLAAPDDGKYTVKIKAGADQAGSEPVRMLVKLGNETVKEFKVTAKKSSPATVSVTLPLVKGANRIAVAFANPHTEAAPAATTPARPATTAAAKPGVRALFIDQVEIAGPPGPAVPESHKRIFIAKPGPDLDQRAAARVIIERFATRAFRQPVTTAKLDRLLTLFDLAEKEGETFNGAVRVALEGVLISPFFLYRLEQERAGSPGGVTPINDWELASRLSYFLWSSMPDDELFELAKAGKLHERAVLDQQIKRMLQSPKSRALVSTFAEQWLRLRALDRHEPDPSEFPDFDKPLRKAMYDEATMFFEMVMREDRSILEFLDSDYTFLNERLAKHYGIAGVTGAQMRKVTLSDRKRGGVVSMASVLTVTSGPTRTSPVKRGQWILDQILGDPPPPPPPGVAPLPAQDKKSGAGLTLRQQMERHRADPTCASCHQRMDQIGFGFENFDGTGRWRDREGSVAVDASGALPGGVKFNGPVEFKTMLLANKQDFARTLSGKLLTFALGRALQDHDDVTLDQVAQAVERDQYRFSSLVTNIATSFPFLNRRVK
jgi:Protein of unknown function (DUF1592)/Protein of unknown function (DUF1588)/Protein of unknown function (DUF1587)/Protein of unknown function (DUF1585)/Protein of unknown function (DUF1595)/Planctomycete cytochrome C